MSNKKRTELVLALLLGEPIELLSMDSKVPVHQLTQWRAQFITHGSSGFKKQPTDSKVSELERIISRQHMEIELLKKRKTGFAKINANSSKL